METPLLPNNSLWRRKKTLRRSDVSLLAPSLCLTERGSWQQGDKVPPSFGCGQGSGIEQPSPKWEFLAHQGGSELTPLRRGPPLCLAWNLARAESGRPPGPVCVCSTGTWGGLRNARSGTESRAKPGRWFLCFEVFCLPPPSGSKASFFIFFPEFV